MTEPLVSKPHLKKPAFSLERVFDYFLPAIYAPKARHNEEALKKLRRFFTTHKNERKSGYLNQPDIRSAYLSYYFPLHLPETFWILNQLKTLGIEIEPKSIADIGAGPGTATYAALAWLVRFATKKGRFNEKYPIDISLYDHSLSTLKDATKLMRSFEGIQCEYTHVDFRASAPKLGKTFDLMLISHFFNEWGSGPRIRSKKYNLLTQFLDHLSPNGVLILIEPPLRECTLDVMHLRNAIEADEVFEVLAPCPQGHKFCPMLQNKVGWCYAQPPRDLFKAESLVPWDKKIERLLQINVDKASFSYLVIARKGAHQSRSHKVSLSNTEHNAPIQCTEKGIRKGASLFRGDILLANEGAKPAAKKF